MIHSQNISIYLSSLVQPFNECFQKNSFDNSQEVRRSLDWVLTVCRAIKAVQRLNQIIMKSALWLWQIYHIRWHTLTRSDPTRPEQTKLEGQGEATKLEPSAEIVGANLGEHGQVSIRRQQSVHSSWSGCLPARIQCVYTTTIQKSVQYIRPSVCPPAGDTQRLLTCW